MADRMVAMLRLFQKFHSADTVGELFARAAESTCIECGFDRAIVLGITDGRLKAMRTSPPVRAANARLHRAVRSASIPLVPGTDEHVIVNRAVVGPRGPSAARSLLAESLGLDHHAYAAIVVERTTRALLVVDREARPVRPSDLAQIELVAEAVASELVRLDHRAQLESFKADFSAELDRFSSLAHGLGVSGGTPSRVPVNASTGAALGRSDPAVRRQLTDRELQVMEHLVDGRSNIEIAEALGLSPDTIKTHVRRISRKLGALNRVEAVSLHLRRR